MSAISPAVLKGLLFVSKDLCLLLLVLLNLLLVFEFVLLAFSDLFVLFLRFMFFFLLLLQNLIGLSLDTVVILAWFLLFVVSAHQKFTFVRQDC
jgi:hypothetical protein